MVGGREAQDKKPNEEGTLRPWDLRKEEEKSSPHCPAKWEENVPGDQGEGALTQMALPPG